MSKEMFFVVILALAVGIFLGVISGFLFGLWAGVIVGLLGYWLVMLTVRFCERILS